MNSPKEFQSIPASIETDPIPQTREVASGMRNLGNTCYMNAVLQALAHSPELCHAIDSLPHHSVCPIALQNDRDEKLKKVSDAQHNENKNNNGSANNSPSQENTASTTSKKKNSRKKKVDILAETAILTGKYCALCEFEKHIVRVHQSGSSQNHDADSPNSSVNLGGNDLENSHSTVAPSDFVRGFIGDVAPWFKLGVQEDSHEFLRLLIDAMQNSCKDSPKKKEEYPFQLFQGSIQSSVKCSACGASNVTYDPFEDIGLEVAHHSSIPMNSNKRNTSPTPAPSEQPKLADVPKALERFTRMEHLDSQYKCEKCHTLGSGTKESRLARIPPILTLHLKRFRYGQQGNGGLLDRGLNHAYDKGGSLHSLGSSLGGSLGMGGGTSGSAKIEGHVRFDQFFDIRRFLTKELQSKHRSVFCRLFAVIVHTGKNSHSGHYISYVRNLAKNEWWMMDDAHITRVKTEEVVNSEAYMLFYRVVDHPVGSKLKVQAMERFQQKAQKKKEEEALMEKQKNEDENTNNVAKLSKDDESQKKEKDTEKENIETEVTSSSSPSNHSNETSNQDNTPGSKKRARPKFSDGYEWAKKRMKLPKALSPFIHRMNDKISDGAEFKFDYFQFITNEASKNGKIGAGPSGVSCKCFECAFTSWI